MEDGILREFSNYWKKTDAKVLRIYQLYTEDADISNSKRILDIVADHKH